MHVVDTAHQFEGSEQSLARGLDISQRGMDIAFLEAAQPDVRDRFSRISHYDYYGNLGIFLDLSDVTLEAVETDSKEPLRKKNEGGSSFEFWEIGDFFTDEIMTWMSDPKVPKLTEDEVKEALGINLKDYLEGVAIADITEAGIIAYPADINYVFNPLNIVTPQRFIQTTGAVIPKAEIPERYKDVPTNALFPPTWATQEYYHTDVGVNVLRGAGYDMRSHKKRKMAWQSTASTPMPRNTPRGTFYTDFQEGSTTNYYVGASRIAAQLAELAFNLGKIESFAFWHASSGAFAITGREEAGHRTYIRATRRAAVQNGDEEVRSYAYKEWANEIAYTDRNGKPVLPMPGYFIEGFPKGSLAAQRAGLYGQIGALKSVLNTLNASSLDEPGDLNPEGEEAVERLTVHRELVADLISRYTEKAAKKGKATRR